MGSGKSGARSPSWCLHCSGTGYLTNYRSLSGDPIDRRGRTGGGGNILGVLILLALAWFFWGPESSDRAVRPAPRSPRSNVEVPSELPRTEVATTPEAAPAPPSAPAPRPLVLKAEHKHSFGKECQGEVEISADEFDYRSPDHPLSLSRTEIARIDGSGFEDRDGKKWHFRLEGRDDEEVEALLSRWLAGADVRPAE